MIFNSRKNRLLFYLTILIIGGRTLSELRAAELLVADRATNRVLVYNPTTGAFDHVLVDQDPSNLFSPAALAIGFGGDLFVASQATGKVLRYNSATGAPNGNAPGDPTFLSLLNGPSGLWYDAAAGHLFVSLLGNADSTIVNVYDSTGSSVGSISAGPAGGRTGVVLDSSGNLFVNSFNTDGFAPNGGETGAVLKFSGPNFNTMQTLIAGNGTYNDNFFGGIPVNVAGMAGLAIQGDSLFAASLFGQEVLKLDADTGGVQAVLGTHFQPTPPGPPTAYPSGLLIDGDGNLLVTTLGNNNPNDPIYGQFTFPGSVQKFAPDGTFLGVLVVGGDSLNDEPGVGFQPTAVLLSPVPEPAAWLLMIAGAAALIVVARRRYRCCPAAAGRKPENRV